MIDELPAGQREKEVFLLAMELEPGEEREALLTEACRGRSGLRDSVASLIEACSEPHPLIDALTKELVLPERFAEPEPDRSGGAPTGSPKSERPTAVATVDRGRSGPGETKPGHGISAWNRPTQFPRIPGYELEEEIGEGGFARVYRARELGALPRTVAIKVLKRGMDTERIIERFSVERRVLASMDHPNIATALVSGETEDMRPYVVMELLSGPNVVRYAQEQSLSLESRLRLFLDICRGVQHAHQYGVIHRDLKPSNVLVSEIDGRPTPRIIDFGIAKALHPDAAEISELANQTQPGELVGTPAYMSPEQLEGSPARADTRTDVYALGSLLFELLTGTPLVPQTATRSSILNGFKERLANPSLAMPSASTSDPKLSRALRGDLDCVTAKALEVEAGRRYQSVSALAEDIECHLVGLPIRARINSTTYLLGRSLRRHRRLILRMAVLVVAAGIGAGFWVRERINGLLVQREIEGVSSLFSEFQKIVENDIESKDRAEYLRIMIARCHELRAAGPATPSKAFRLFYSDLWSRLGQCYDAQGDHDGARDAFERSLAERKAVFGDHPRDKNAASLLSGAYASLAKPYRSELDFDRAGQLYQETLRLNGICLDLDPPSLKYRNNLAATLASIGVCHYMEGRIAEARRNFDEAIAVRRELAAGFDDLSQQQADFVTTLYNYVRFQFAQGPVDEAVVIPLVDEILRVRSRRAEDRPADLRRRISLAAAVNLAALASMRSGDLTRCRERAGEALGHWDALATQDGSRIDFLEGQLEAQMLIAEAALGQGDLDSARKILEEARASAENPSWAPSSLSPFLKLDYYLNSARLERLVGDRRSCDEVLCRATEEMARLTQRIPNHPELHAYSARLAGFSLDPPDRS